MKSERQMEAFKKNLPGFQKGKSGNPNGRPAVPDDVKEAAKAHTMDAISTLVDVMHNSANPNARVGAATAILNRGWGQPKQTVDVDVTQTIDITSMLAQLEARDAKRALTSSEAAPLIIEATENVAQPT